MLPRGDDQGTTRGTNEVRKKKSDQPTLGPQAILASSGVRRPYVLQGRTQNLHGIESCVEST